MYADLHQALDKDFNNFLSDYDPSSLAKYGDAQRFAKNHYYPLYLAGWFPLQ